ncbi:MAG: twin-arginine translocase subunit TatC [Chloroflexota bacterium]
MNSASTILLLFLAIIAIGPSKLPSGIESIWLALTNLANAQRGLPTIDIEQARRIWKTRRSPILSLINLLYAAAEHLEELRKRFIVVAVVFAIGTVTAGIFADQLLEFIKVPVGDVELIFIRPPEMFVAYFNLVITAAALVTTPILLMQILLFISPAFESDIEKKAFRIIRAFAFPAVMVLFIAGAAFSYYLMLPVALDYFAQFAGDTVSAQWTISAYLKFVLNIIIWMGVAFETPLLIMLLARFGVVSAKELQKGWRVAFVVTAIIAAIITPTPDPLNMSIVWLPLFGLYLLGVVLAHLVGKKST